MATTKPKVLPKIDLRIELGTDKIASPTTTVSWTLPTELITHLEKEHFIDPYILLVVASKGKASYHNRDSKEQFFDEYTPTSMYFAKIDPDLPSREYISFSRSGNNVVIATIIDVRSANDMSDLRRAKKYVKEISIIRDGTIEFDNYYNNRLQVFSRQRIETQTVQPVIVDKELFAKPYPKWARRMVREFYSDSEFDQCHFRGRFLKSIPLTIAVQLYGIFARLLTLVFGIVLLMRGMSFRTFFALNPHDFAHGLYSSWWYVDKQGRDRPVLRWINPISILGYVAAFAITSILTLLYFTVKSLFIKGDVEALLATVTLQEYLLTTLVIDAIIAAIVFLGWLAFSYEGQSLATSLYKKLVPASSIQIAEAVVPEGFYSRLTAKTAAGEMNVLIDDTPHLKFQALKSKVCKPYER